MLNQNSRPQSLFVSQATPSADQINQDLKNRYGDLLNQADQEGGKLKTTPLLQSPKLLEQLDPKLTAEVKQKQQELQQSQTQASSSILDPFLGLPLPVQAGIGVATGLGLISFGVLGARGLSAHFKKAQYLKKFDQGSGQKIQAYLAKEPKQLAWWDQPRFGEKSLGQYVLNAFYKPPLPESIVFMHQRGLEQLTNLNKKTSLINVEKFNGQEFAAYLRVRSELTSSKTSGLGMYYSAQRLRAALAAKRNFDQIWQIESQYYGRKQQEYYRYVDECLKKGIDGEEFKIKLEEKLVEILPQVLHEKGQEVLKAYSKMVVELSTFEYGLELLHMFKQYSLADYVVLRQIDELLNKLKILDLTETTLLKPEIMANFDAFEKLAPIIKMPKKLLNPDGFVELVHYSVLEVKHQVSYRQFKELISLLERWVEPYKEVNELRRTCSANQYRLPKEFGMEIPGLKIFEKYKSVLDVQV